MRHLERFAGLLLIVVSAVNGLAEQSKGQPWLGMAVTAHRDREGQRFLHVERTTASGPAARAGIRPGDIITRVNGAPLQLIDDLDFLLFLAEQTPGKRIRFLTVRTGRPVEIAVVVGTMPESARAGWERALAGARKRRAAHQRRERQQ